MHVSATNLDTWARTNDAKARLPEVIRRLILATTPGLQRVEFRSEEGMYLGGWDGRTVANPGTAFVPTGPSGWEVSVREDITQKANDDYEARKTQAGGFTPADSTFIFATAHRWAGRDTWEATKRDEGHWLDVRAYDADSLITWLGEAPAVDTWLARHLGLQPYGVMDIEGFWGVLGARYESNLAVSDRYGWATTRGGLS